VFGESDALPAMPSWVSVFRGRRFAEGYRAAFDPAAGENSEAPGGADYGPCPVLSNCRFLNGLRPWPGNAHN
jgi:hypothetical protein